MPSWPARLHLASPTSSSPAPRLKSNGPRSPPIQNQHFDSSNQDPLLHGVPVLVPQERIAPSLLTLRPRHERAYSHPFPSMFSSGRRGTRHVKADAHDDTSDYFDGVLVDSTPPALKDVMIATNGTTPQDAEKDLRKGRCKTCDSLVRWPAHLNVFRCTMCQMINDLESSGGPVLARPDDAMNGTTLPSKSAPVKKVARLSLDTTRNLIDESLRLYLQPRLTQGLRNGHQDPQRPLSHSDKESRPVLLPLKHDDERSEVTLSSPNIPSPSRAPPPPPKQNISVKFADDTTGDATRHDPESSRYMFRLLENYVTASFSNVECLNASFTTRRPVMRAASESNAAGQCVLPKFEDFATSETPFPDMDAKTLLLGDFAENGIWWTGRSPAEQHRSKSNASRPLEEGLEELVTARSPRINWAEVNEWYHMIIHAGHHWKDRLRILQGGESWDQGETGSLETTSAEVLNQVEDEVLEACAHVQKALLKATEKLLLRPGRPLRHPEDCRFLLVLLSNPLLYSSDFSKPNFRGLSDFERAGAPNQKEATAFPPPQQPLEPARKVSNSRSGTSSRHSGITKRILGLLANLPSKCHQRLVSWFSRLSEAHLRSLVDLIGRFVTYRLSRQHGRKRSSSHDPTGGLIPSISGPGAGTPAHLHAALGISQAPKTPEKTDGIVAYSDDWQIKVAARVMSLLFTANVQGLARGHEASRPLSAEDSRPRAASAARNRAHRHGQILPTNAFYNTMLDYSDLVADFEAWESRKGKFSFCQYPMFLSIWAKIRIMEHDARRQMEIKAREAFFESIMSRKAVNQYLVLKVRRDCLVDDSLRGVSEVVGQGPEEIKKGLKIEFKGEEGLDSGGLRKEWFLLLVREVFDPEHGLFIYDDESQYCYFNPNTFETSDQFFLVGVLLGLAIYNSTILDVALPPFAFRKLLAGAPNYTGPTTTSIRPPTGYTLEDLAEFRPSLAHGLRQLLDFEGNVEEAFALDFVADFERYGQREQIALCPDGQNKPVTNSNRREFVDLYIRYLLDTSVARQYEPFKRGFFTVCGGNALSLFRPEEIELLVRGSDEPLDVPTLRSVAIYENWGKTKIAADEPVVDWFWEAFARAIPKAQRKLLSFITSSDRIPAMGTTSLVIKIVCLGDSNTRFPIARTCFNMLGLYRYSDREKLEDRLWKAVEGSEGFGMK
ncbi:putative E3 ubiquitin-protein ligase [Puttea exsequens]|nr:putative E3 ubiquitin-protein ligase [Puttea exsequens]